MRARTPVDMVPCPSCGARSGRVHGFHLRTVLDVPVDGRRAVVRVRRLVCPTRDCRHTFRERVPGVLEPHQRRTDLLTRQVMAVVKELAGQGSFAGDTRGRRLAAHRSSDPGCVSHCSPAEYSARSASTTSTCVGATAMPPCSSMAGTTSGSTCYPIAFLGLTTYLITHRHVQRPIGFQQPDGDRSRSGLFDCRTGFLPYYRPLASSTSFRARAGRAYARDRSRCAPDTGDLPRRVRPPAALDR